MFKKLTLLILLLVLNTPLFADDAATAVGANGVVIDLVGDFYNPNLVDYAEVCFD